MSRNRHKNKNYSNHPKPKNEKLIDNGSLSYSPNSIGGRIDLESLRDKLFAEEQKNTNTITNHNNNSNAKDSQTGI